MSRPRSRSPTHKSEPYSYGGEFDEGEVVCVVLFVARRHGSEMFEFVVEAFDEISETYASEIHPGCGLAVAVTVTGLRPAMRRRRS